MSQIETHILTTLPVEDCASVFYRAIHNSQSAASKVGGFLAKMKGAGEGLEFFTPEWDPGRAAAGDLPTLAVGAHVPRLYRSAYGETTDVQMHIWDRGDVRDVRVMCDHSVTGGAHAKQVVSGVAAAIQAADTSAELQ